MAALQGVKILLAESELFLASVYATKLELEGCTVLHAEDGEQCLKLAEKHVPDVILLDTHIPKLDGFETLRRLKQNQTLAKIPVAMITDLCRKEDVERCLKEGAMEFMIKAHVVPSDMVRKVKKILQVA